MTYYDDCLYCSTCGWHHEDCWCRGGVLRDPDEQVCHRPNPDEGPGELPRADQPCTPTTVSVKFATGGIVRGPGAKDDDRVPFPLTGCMFSDVARVFVLPDRTEGSGS